MSNKEIGSEFWTNCTPQTIDALYSICPKSIYDNYPYAVIETISGRTALEHIVEILVKEGKTSVYLPTYCCHTMIEPFLTHGMKVSFYDVMLSNNGLHRDIDLDNNYDVVFLMDYFGHTDEETLRIALYQKQRGKTLIYDATHSMYSNIEYDPYDFVYGSYRKWLDINCGFLAWKKVLSHGVITQNDNYEAYASIRTELFDKKSEFIKGGLIKKEEFLPLINMAETILEEQYHHKKPDPRSLEMLKHADAEYIKKRRIDNAKILTEAINKINDERIHCFNPILNTFDTPLFVPVFVSSKDRGELRKHLTTNSIYCPIHWPLSEFHPYITNSKALYDSELSLICDQRYDGEDMFRIIDNISNYLQK